jgi:hypothetical protein
MYLSESKSGHGSGSGKFGGKKGGKDGEKTLLLSSDDEFQ